MQDYKATMKLRRAVNKAKDAERIREILDEDGFLCSAFVLLSENEEIEEWNLGFYSPEGDEITAVKVSREETEMGVTDEPLRENTHEIKLGKVEVSASEALGKTREVLEEEYGGGFQKALFSLKSSKEEKSQRWSATFIRGGLTVVSIEIDAESGEVVASEKRKIGSTGPSVGG